MMQREVWDNLSIEEKIEFVEKEIPEEVLEELRNHFQTLYTETFENQMEHYEEDNEGWEKYEKHFQLFMMIPHGITKLHPKVDWW
tara:strand:+ start:1893 stop:2147 length:255 start_codon:yes stop_codon:yes gene_type:complete